MEIKPFRAFRFDQTVVGDVGNCIAPPYDVISPAQQEQLYQKSEYNIVRIIKGKTAPSDNESDNQYTRAADYFNTWIEKGVLKQDPAEAIYPYVQDFQLAGRNFQRFSFIASAKLEEFGKMVRPHEQTLKEPIIDRLNLKRATAARFGLPFCLYEDPHNITDKIIENAARQKPLVDSCDEQNVRHRLFAITKRDDITAIAEMIFGKRCIIADGHHRYITGLAYSKENPNPAAKYQMLAFANIRQQGLIVLATHRLVGNLEKLNFKEFIAQLSNDFQITEYHFDSPQTRTEARQKMLAQMKAEHNKDRNAFGIYLGNGAFYVAVLKNKSAMDAAAPDMSAHWRLLDVSVLHKLILDGQLNVGEKQLAEGGNVTYVKDTNNTINELIATVDTGQKHAAFFMNPTKMEQIKKVADCGERMPQKSTYFYPKIYTGLTISKL